MTQCSQVRLKMCCHTPNSNPKFAAEIGDFVLVRVEGDALQEMELTKIDPTNVTCRDVTGTTITVKNEQLIAVVIQ